MHDAKVAIDLLPEELPTDKNRSREIDLLHLEGFLKNVLIFQGEAFDFYLFVKLFGNFVYKFYIFPPLQKNTQPP